MIVLSAAESWVIVSWETFIGLLPWMGVAVVMLLLSARVLSQLHQMRFPRVDDGAPPLDHDLIDTWYGTRHTQAAHAPVPEHLVWSPRVSVSTTNADLGQVGQQPTPRQVSLSALLDQGGGLGLIFGVDLDSGEPARVDGEVTSCGIVGRPGSGKSSTAAWLALQVVRGLKGRVLLGDPHASKARSITNTLRPLGLKSSRHPADILELAKEAYGELVRRKAERGEAKRAQDWPLWVLMIDEWTALMRGEVGEALAPILANIVSEGQGYGVVCCLMAQDWRMAAVGEGVRNQIPTTVIHRCRPEDARMASGLRAEALPGDTMDLPTGVCYLVSPEGMAKVQVPHLTADELAGLGAASAPASAFRQPTVRRSPYSPETPMRDADGRLADVDEDLARTVIETFMRTGGDYVAVVNEVYGLKPGGVKYQRARQEVGALIAEALSHAGPAPQVVEPDDEPETEGAA